MLHKTIYLPFCFFIPLTLLPASNSLFGNNEINEKRDFIFVIIFLGSIFSLNICEAIQELLPTTDSYIVAAEPLSSGLSHTVIKYTTLQGNQYVLRRPQKIGCMERFHTVLAISRQAAALQIAPHIYNVDDAQQYILMRYIPHISWPSYEAKSAPYHATMRVVKSFHDAMREQHHPTSFQPFAAILRREAEFVDNPQMPSQMKTAFERMRILYEQSLPWIAEHATIYHGDLKQKNILLEQEGEQIRPWLVDFEYAAVGHPYFDVVKFSQKLSHDQRMSLFESYLGHAPTQEELTQFSIADSALRMLIAIIRFDITLKVAADNSSALMSKEEMEELLCSAKPLPSQTTILVSDPDPKRQQLAALYALDDFLRHSETE